MSQVKEFLEGISLKRISHGFEGWLASTGGKNSISVSQWKIAMLILLVLYPTVMVTAEWISSLVDNCSRAYSMFLTGTFVVSVLTWVAMPEITRVIGFWLSIKATKDSKSNLYGVLSIILIYVILVFTFNWLQK
ncbi:hypothetical protein ACCI51_15955 [Microbulbifer echini]|uniref:Uncharacterized protein n=1 Tax=Microbulbifer echini TaxID=1529067 RepID=A0ABV4NRL7_9GAMM